MNIIKTLNQLDKIIEEKCYNKIFEYFDFIEDYLSIISDLVIKSINLEIENATSMDEFNKIIEKYMLMNENNVLNTILVKEEIKL